MTRSELIEAIIAENYRVKGKRVINVWELPDSRRRKSNKDVLDHYRKELGNTAKLAHLTAMVDQLKKERGVSEDEDKWLRMKRHIAQGANEQGLTGKRRNAYIYGAMRARGWKPGLDEGIGRTVKRAGSFVKRDAVNTYNDISSRVKDIATPITRYKKAAAYRSQGKQALARGEFDRGLTMINRGSRVMSRYAPEVVGTGAGALAGFSLGVAIPGSTEIGAIGGQRLSRGIANMVARNVGRKKRGG